MGLTLAGRMGFGHFMRTYMVGMFLGCLLLMIISAYLCLLLFNLIPKIEPYMRWGGFAYIMYLAWIIYRDKPSGEKRPLLRPDSILAGAVMQFLNVKGILYIVTSFSTFIIPSYNDTFTLGLFAVVLTITSCLATTTWAGMGVALQRVFTAHPKATNLIMALLLVYCACTLVV
jgi:threonine/homoserine/homoserine lactone efflux protein